MIDEVFSPSFGNKPRELIGRNEEMDLLCSALNAKPGSKERATLMIGQRGTGKTVLLLELADYAHRSGFITVSVKLVRVNSSLLYRSPVRSLGARP